MKIDPFSSKLEERTQRKRGAQPGNLNALKHGHYSRRLREPGAEADLEEEIVLLRTLVRRTSELAADPKVNPAFLLKALVAMGSATDRLARLLRTQKEFGETSSGIEAVISQAIAEVARELGLQ
jgi:hypothetical protein